MRLQCRNELFPLYVKLTGFSRDVSQEEVRSTLDSYIRENSLGINQKEVPVKTVDDIAALIKNAIDYRSTKGDLILISNNAKNEPVVVIQTYSAETIDIIQEIAGDVPILADSLSRAISTERKLFFTFTRPEP